MKILFVAPQPFFQVRGTCLATLRLLETLAKQGHGIDMLTFPGGSDRRIEGVRIRRTPNPFGFRRIPIGPSVRKGILDIFLTLSLVASLVRRRYDVVHAGEEAAFIAALVCPLFRVPFIYDMDSHLTAQLRESGFIRSRALLRPFEAWERLTFGRAAAVAVITPGFRDLVLRARADDRVFLIEDIPIAREWGDARSSRRTLRAREGLRGVPVVVYTGNLAPYQGLSLLIACMPHVLAEVPDVRFAVIGGEESDIAPLRRAAERLGVADSVLFTGQLPLEVIFGELSDADVLVSTRLKGENTPFKVYEYMAAGKPVVATDLPMHRPVLDETTAYLAAPEPEPFAAAIVHAIRNPEEAARRAQAARERVETLYSIENYQKKVSALYASLADDASVRPAAK